MSEHNPLLVPHIIQVDCRTDPTRPERPGRQEMCGAACVEMVLKHIGASLAEVSQLQIYSSTRRPPRGFRGGALANYPGSMAKAIAKWSPDRLIKYQVLDDGTDSALSEVRGILKNYSSEAAFRSQIDAFSSHIAETIQTQQTATIIAVRQANAHWVVVHGFTGSPDTPRSFFLRNPLGQYLPYTTSLDPDTVCEITDDLREDVVAYDFWKSDYFPFFLNNRYGGGRGSTVEDEPWKNRFFLISSYEKATLTNARAPLRTASTPGGGTVAPSEGQVRPLPGGGIGSTHDDRFGPLSGGQSGFSLQITPEQARDAAKTAIVNYNLLKPSLWNEVSGSPWTPSYPFYVKQLNSNFGNYYLVPVLNNLGKSPILVRISARDGKFQEATVWAHSKDKAAGTIIPGDFTPYFSRNQALQQYLPGKKVLLGGSTHQIQIASPHPEGVFAWKPCLESFSSFKPFYQFLAKLESGITIPIYLPIDSPGIVLTTLTEPTVTGL